MKVKGNVSGKELLGTEGQRSIDWGMLVIGVSFEFTQYHMCEMYYPFAAQPSTKQVLPPFSAKRDKLAL